VLRVREETELVIGGARRAGDRYIIPVIRTLVLHAGRTAVVSLTPVALIIAEGECEYLIRLPGAPRSIESALDTLRGDIDRQKRECPG